MDVWATYLLQTIQVDNGGAKHYKCEWKTDQLFGPPKSINLI